MAVGELEARKLDHSDGTEMNDYNKIIIRSMHAAKAKKIKFNTFVTFLYVLHLGFFS